MQNNPSDMQPVFENEYKTSEQANYAVTYYQSHGFFAYKVKGLNIVKVYQNHDGVTY